MKPSRLAAAMPAGKTPLRRVVKDRMLGRVGPARAERRLPRAVVQALAQALDDALAATGGTASAPPP